MDDPGGVRALLAKLREQDEVPEQPRPEPSATQRPWASNPKRPAFLQQNETYDPWKPVFEEKSEPKAPAKDLRTMRFADALPIVTEKARDPVFIAELKRVGTRSHPDESGPIRAGAETRDRACRADRKRRRKTTGCRVRELAYTAARGYKQLMPDGSGKRSGAGIPCSTTNSKDSKRYDALLT